MFYTYIGVRPMYRTKYTTGTTTGRLMAQFLPFATINPAKNIDRKSGRSKSVSEKWTSAGESIARACSSSRDRGALFWTSLGTNAALQTIPEENS